MQFAPPVKQNQIQISAQIHSDMQRQTETGRDTAANRYFILLATHKDPDMCLTIGFVAEMT